VSLICQLRFDKDSTYPQLLDTAGTTFLYNQRIHNMLTSIFKCLHYENFPKYLKELLTSRPSVYPLRGTDILSLFTPVTTSYGLHSFRYFAAKTWNSLPDNFREEPSLAGFKRLLKVISFQE
jgi:hypothetical protein